MKFSIFSLLLIFLSGCVIFHGKKTSTKPHNNLQKGNAEEVKGNVVDAHTRCVHYHSEKDIIAILMKCCNEYYPCIECHNETAGHAATVWPKNEFDTKAVLCGMCYHEMTINEYLQSNNQCPKCKAAFNPGCANHYHLYFEIKKNK